MTFGKVAYPGMMQVSAGRILLCLSMAFFLAAGSRAQSVRNEAVTTTSGNFTAGTETFMTKAKVVVGNKLSTMTFHDYPPGFASDVSSVSSFLEKFWQPDPAPSKYAKKYTVTEINDPSTGIKRSIDAVKKQGIRFRIAELNSICQGGSDGISNSFGAALWSIDFMYELALAGGHLHTAGNGSRASACTSSTIEQDRLIKL